MFETKIGELDFNISLEGNDHIEFYIKGFLVARGYQCIVIGKRGAYLEFSPNQIILENIFVPKSEMYRINSDKVYYIEYRTKLHYEKVYFQKKTVKYAEYKIGFYYISPINLCLSWKKEAKRVLKNKAQSSITKFLEV